MNPKGSLSFKDSSRWNHGERVRVAQLILSPESNGGWSSGNEATPEQFAHVIAKRDVPLWAVVYKGRIVATVGLDPVQNSRGLLHFTHDRTLPRQQQLRALRQFLKKHRHIDTYAVVTRPGLARLAQRQGFAPVPLSELRALFPQVLMAIEAEGHTPVGLQLSCQGSSQDQR